MNYQGIDEEVLNRIATLDAYSDEELFLVTNAYWRKAFGHNVLYFGGN